MGGGLSTLRVYKVQQCHFGISELPLVFIVFKKLIAVLNDTGRFVKSYTEVNGECFNV